MTVRVFLLLSFFCLILLFVILAAIEIIAGGGIDTWRELVFASVSVPATAYMFHRMFEARNEEREKSR